MLGYRLNKVKPKLIGSKSKFNKMLKQTVNMLVDNLKYHLLNDRNQWVRNTYCLILYLLLCLTVIM